MLSALKKGFSKFPDMGAVIARFPLPVVFMAVFTVILMIEGSIKDEHMARVLGGIVIVAYLSVSAVLAAESRGRKPSALLQIGLFAVIVPLAWFSKQLHLNIPMAIGAAVLLLGNAVIWRQSRNDLHVWDFTHKLWTGAGFALAGSIIYTWGMFAIMAALRSLFDVKIDDVMQHLLLPLGLGFLAPLYWLASLPPVDEDYSELYENPGFVSKAVTFMGTWLLSPLTLIYALILLAYGLKIIIAGELPNGEIAQLTSPFLIVGTLTWLALEPPFSSKNKLAQMFRKLWWPVSIPAALLLAVAVFVRIGEYGFTPDRFALLALIIWALGLALWFTFAPMAKRDIRLIPGAAAVLLTLGAVGSGGLSLVNQGARFESNLSAAVTVSQDGQVTDIKDMTAARRAKGALNYLMRHTGEGRVKRALKAASISFDGDEFSFANVQKTLAFENVVLPNRYSNHNSINYSNPEKLISVAGFDNLYGPFNIYPNSIRNRYDINSKDFTLSSNGPLLLFKLGDETFTFDFKDWKAKQNFAKNPSERQTMQVSIETPYIQLLDTPERKVTLFIEGFNSWDSFGGHGSDDMNLSANFYVLTQGLDKTPL